MKRLIFVLLVLWVGVAFAEAEMEKDEFDFGGKKLEITFIKHGTLMFDYDGTVIHIDPVLMFGTDYSKLPAADILIVTHEHGDHFDPAAIRAVLKEGTKIVTNESVFKLMKNEFKNVTVMKNGDKAAFGGIKLEAVPAYNTTPENRGFHPKGRDNGFVFDFGKGRVYVSGDTEDIPELKRLSKIDIAFLSANQPYTMTVAQCVNAAKMFSPKIMYPYHYNDTDVEKIAADLKGSKTQVRIRQLQ